MQCFWQTTILLLCYAYHAMASGLLRLHLNNNDYEFKVELTNIISFPNGKFYFRIPYNELERKGLQWPIQLDQTNSSSSIYIANEVPNTFNVTVDVEQDGVTPEAPVYYKREAEASYDKKGTVIKCSAEQENSGEALEADAEDEDDGGFEATLVKDHTGKWLGAVFCRTRNEQGLKDFAKTTYLLIDGTPNFYLDNNVYIIVMADEEGVAID